MPKVTSQHQGPISLKQQLREMLEPMPQELATALFFELLEEASLAHERGEIIASLHPDCIWLEVEGDVCRLHKIERLMSGEGGLPGGSGGIAEEARGGDGRSVSMGSLVYDMLSGASIFVAPEIHEGAAFSEATDIFALGVLAHIILAGAIPAAHPLPTVATKSSDKLLYQPFDDVIAKACTVEEGGRYGDVDALKQAFEKAILAVAVRKKAKEELKDQAKDAVKDAIKDQLKKKGADAAKEVVKKGVKKAAQAGAKSAAKGAGAAASGGAAGAAAGAAGAGGKVAVVTAKSAAVWAGVVIGSILVVGAGYLLYRTLTGAPSPRQEPALVAKRVVKKAPTRRVSAPARRRVLVRSGRVVKKPGGCGAGKIFIRVSPKLAKDADISVKKGTPTRIAGGFCIGADGGEVLIDQPGDVRCVFQLPKGQKQVDVWLKKEGLSLLSPDYCRKK